LSDSLSDSFSSSLSPKKNAISCMFSPHSTPKHQLWYLKSYKGEPSITKRLAFWYQSKTMKHVHEAETFSTWSAVTNAISGQTILKRMLSFGWENMPTIHGQLAVLDRCA
jgi:hypothetical protein